MENSTNQSSADQLPGAVFDSWSGCWNALKKLPHPASGREREDILDRIDASPQRMQLAFEILCFMREPKFPSRLRWLEASMVQILGGGDEEPCLEAKTVPSEARAWVFREFREVENVSDWKRFLTCGRHLWVLYAILKSTSNKHVLVEALTTLSDCAEHCLNTSADGKKKRHFIRAIDAVWIAKTIKGRISAKLDLPRPFLEALFAITATADLSESLRRETDGLRSRLKDSAEELDVEKKARSAGEERTAELQTRLEATQRALEKTQTELTEERLHITRQGGFNEVAKSETVNKVMSLVRQNVAHRLENIVAYADREKPDQEEILALVAEIQKRLGAVEEAMNT